MRRNSFLKSLIAALMMTAVAGAATTAVLRYLEAPVEIVRIAGELTEVERQRSARR